MNTTSELNLIQSQAVSAARTQKADAAGREPSDELSEFEKMLVRQSEEAARQDVSAQEGDPVQDGDGAEDGVLPDDDVSRQLAAMALLSGGAVFQPFVQETAAPEENAQLNKPAVTAAAADPAPVLTQETQTGGTDDASTPAFSGLRADPQTAEQTAPAAARTPGVSESDQAAAQTRQAAAPASPAEQTGSETAQDARLTRDARPPALAKDGEGMHVETAGSQETTFQPLFRNVEAVPVKVGETPAAVDAQAPDLDAQLARQLEATLSGGAEKVEIRLTPANLGALVVQLTRTQDGALQVAIQTTTEKAAELLNRHSASLGAMLQESTQAPVQVEIQRQNEAQQYQQQQQQQQQQQSRDQRQEQDAQRQSRQQSRAQGEDFLNQLRLGLIPLDERVS